jgi:hypothetical protein
MNRLLSPVNEGYLVCAHAMRPHSFPPLRPQPDVHHITGLTLYPFLLALASSHTLQVSSLPGIS